MDPIQCSLITTNSYYSLSPSNQETNGRSRTTSTSYGITSLGVPIRIHPEKSISRNIFFGGAFGREPLRRSNYRCTNRKVSSLLPMMLWSPPSSKEVGVQGIPLEALREELTAIGTLDWASELLHLLHLLKTSGHAGGSRLGSKMRSMAALLLSGIAQPSQHARPRGVPRHLRVTSW